MVRVSLADRRGSVDRIARLAGGHQPAGVSLVARAVERHDPRVS
jgi:hypothetical protein